MKGAAAKKGIVKQTHQLMEAVNTQYFLEVIMSCMQYCICLRYVY